MHELNRGQSFQPYNRDSYALFLWTAPARIIILLPFKNKRRSCSSVISDRWQCEGGQLLRKKFAMATTRHYHQFESTVLRCLSTQEVSLAQKRLKSNCCAPPCRAIASPARNSGFRSLFFKYCGFIRDVRNLFVFWCNLAINFVFTNSLTSERKFGKRWLTFVSLCLFCCTFCFFTTSYIALTNAPHPRLDAQPIETR